LIRALELARLVNDIERLAIVGTLCAQGASDSMRTSADKPGVALRLIRALTGLPSGLAVTAEIDGLLDEAERLYAGQASVLVSVLDLKADDQSLEIGEERVGRVVGQRGELLLRHSVPLPEGRVVRHSIIATIDL